MRRIISGLVLALFLAVAAGSGTAEARGGYASWLKHGDAYRVTGEFAGYQGSFQAQVSWRGNRFVVSTPVGTYPLQRAGAAVTFRVLLDKDWATVTWAHTRVYIVWKGQRGSADVRRIDARMVTESRGNRIR